MRNIIAGFVVLGTLAVATVAPASAHKLSVPPVDLSPAVQQADWDGCGPRCWEHRREVREEWAHERWAQHRRWEEQRRWDESRQYPYSDYGYQRRY